MQGDELSVLFFCPFFFSLLCLCFCSFCQSNSQMTCHVWEFPAWVFTFMCRQMEKKQKKKVCAHAHKSCESGLTASFSFCSERLCCGQTTRTSRRPLQCHVSPRAFQHYPLPTSFPPPSNPPSCFYAACRKLFSTAKDEYFPEPILHSSRRPSSRCHLSTTFFLPLSVISSTVSRQTSSLKMWTITAQHHGRQCFRLCYCVHASVIF